MSRLHELLWGICRKLPSDFAPWGQRERDTAEPWQDCSCGCRHFVPLVGEPGHDWGVCAHPQSPRAGLLTFEHQGCPQFEPEEGADAAPPRQALPATPAPAPSGPPTAPRPHPRINLDEFQLALEASGLCGDVVGHFLDTETGEILVLCRDWEDYEELSQRLDAGLGERYRRIEPLESHESFRIMEAFAASLSGSRWQERLLDALSRGKPFRRFKEIVHSDLALRDQWFRYRDDAHERHVRDWLKEEEIDAEILRRRP